jgi:hypothetical protein
VHTAQKTANGGFAFSDAGEVACPATLPAVLGILHQACRPALGMAGTARAIYKLRNWAGSERRGGTI